MVIERPSIKEVQILFGIVLWNLTGNNSPEIGWSKGQMADHEDCPRNNRPLLPYLNQLQ